MRGRMEAYRKTCHKNCHESFTGNNHSSQKSKALRGTCASKTQVFLVKVNIEPIEPIEPLCLTKVCR